MGMYAYILAMSPKKLTTVFLSDEITAGLESLKARTGASKGELIRRAIVEYLERQAAAETATKADRKRAVTRKRP